MQIPRQTYNGIAAFCVATQFESIQSFLTRFCLSAKYVTYLATDAFKVLPFWFPKWNINKLVNSQIQAYPYIYIYAYIYVSA